MRCQVYCILEMSFTIELLEISYKMHTQRHVLNFLINNGVIKLSN